MTALLRMPFYFIFQMATLLSEQEEKVNTIEAQAAGVSHDTEGGYAASIITYAHGH